MARIDQVAGVDQKQATKLRKAAFVQGEVWPSRPRPGGVGPRSPRQPG